MKLYLVGGTVRDHMLGLPPSSDTDFAVEAESFASMRAALMEAGLQLWQERPEFVTLRGHLPRGSLGGFGGVLNRSPDGTIAADFTLCRKEAMYHDQRHPSEVTPTDIMDDLRRRDYTINAVAVDEDGRWIDPFGGRLAARHKSLLAVGSAYDRFVEDPLRILRGVRFSVTKGLTLLPYTRTMMEQCARHLATVKQERVREELYKALAHDWRATMLLLMVDMPILAQVLSDSFPELWLKPTLERR